MSSILYDVAIHGNGSDDEILISGGFIGIIICTCIVPIIPHYPKAVIICRIMFLTIVMFLYQTLLY